MNALSKWSVIRLKLQNLINPCEVTGRTCNLIFKIVLLFLKSFLSVLSILKSQTTMVAQNYCVIPRDDGLIVMTMTRDQWIKEQKRKSWIKIILAVFLDRSALSQIFFQCLISLCSIRMLLYYFWVFQMLLSL